MCTLRLLPRHFRASTFSSSRAFCAGMEFSGHQATAKLKIEEDSMTRNHWEELHVDKILLRYVAGRGGSTKQKLERDNGVKLWIPSSDQAKRSSSVRIQGSEESVEATAKAIKAILDDAIQSKLQYTHFISLPLALHPTFVEQVTNFQQSILTSIPVCPESSLSDKENTHASGISKSIFVKPATVHLTVLMLKLWNEERVEAASNLLQSAIPAVHEALEGQPVAVNLQGVECMRGPPENAHVLYAKVEDSKDKNRLLEACKVMTDAFVEAGLVLERDIGQKLKLHTTLINTSNRKVRENHGRTKRLPFDAQEIIAKYGKFKWGEHSILEAHLSQRFLYSENGYYHCVSSIPFPQSQH